MNITYFLTSVQTVILFKIMAQLTFICLKQQFLPQNVICSIVVLVHIVLLEAYGFFIFIKLFYSKHT